MFGLFTKTREVVVRDETEISELEAKMQRMRADHESEKRILNNEITLKINEATATHESEKRILNNEITLKINEATAVKDKENQKLREENAGLKKEVDILTRAFENMGFDVKDMKEILNKLVDGVISKNTIQLVK